MLAPLRITALCLCLLPALSSGSGAQDAPLTCTVVQGECQKECRKEAGPLICNVYCSRNFKSCLQTGDWEGRFGDVYRDVVKE